SRDVAYYAQRLNISPKYLNTIVQRTTQHTAKAIIDQYVVMQLKLLLRTSTDPIKQIAWDYQFSDTSFLCRYFKQHTGQTPQQFRISQAEHPLL
ncbi:MAG: AraC family transcriptional regulator, partial [Muribaculaceae bacterium]|nr:AraC family transcriptional regulator [Muribaculaceae bacterium]